MARHKGMYGWLQKYRWRISTIGIQITPEFKSPPFLPTSSVPNATSTLSRQKQFPSSRWSGFILELHPVFGVVPIVDLQLVSVHLEPLGCMQRLEKLEVE